MDFKDICIYHSGDIKNKAKIYGIKREQFLETSFLRGYNHDPKKWRMVEHEDHIAEGYG